MPRSALPPEPTNLTADVAKGSRKPGQRERLVSAMIDLCAERGYHSVTIAQVSSHAGVSSATFYAQFEGKEECLLAAYHAAAKQVLGEMHPVVGVGDWSQAARAGLGAFLSALQSHPAAGRVLLVEARAAGPRLGEERLRALEGFERGIDRFLDRQPKDGQTLDIPARALVGGVRSVIVRYLRTRAEDELPLLAEDMLTWIGSYAIPATEARWSTRSSSLLVETPLGQGSAAPKTPMRLPRGRHRLPAGVVARSRRTRLIYATAEVMMTKGYAEVTVADIVAAAGVSRDVFYEHFTDKQHAFLEAQQHPTQHILDACAAAYFAAQGWPQRVWNGLQTLIGLIVANPAISHLRLVECYAAGPDAIRRAEEITRSFTVFVEEGYGYGPRGGAVPRLCSQAIAGAMFELIQRYIARDEGEALKRALPQLVFIVIAPFTGPQQAAVLVAEMMAAEARAGEEVLAATK
jgi:AcrR family transcriptional regulator